jgi:hypothetical protein
MMFAGSRESAVAIGVGTFLTASIAMPCNYRSRRVAQRLAEAGTWGAAAELGPDSEKGVCTGVRTWH